ncbi:MAG: periplasmic heavy metal sensor [Armatimonadota bacterium]|nr:periplasmic heavy metal sensor [Armatimonadota bacterium]MDR5696162.1 periplasmic heavy metal sensor [Armatimonadota bacterium]
MRRSVSLVALGLAIVVAAGPWLMVNPPEAFAQQSRARRQPCLTEAQRRQAEAIFDRHRVPLRNARFRVADESRALRRLLIAEGTTRAQLDAQAARLAEARNAAQRARIDFLWELRAVLPADQRERAIRCLMQQWTGRMRRR